MPRQKARNYATSGNRARVGLRKFFPKGEQNDPAAVPSGSPERRGWRSIPRLSTGPWLSRPEPRTRSVLGSRVLHSREPQDISREGPDHDEQDRAEADAAEDDAGAAAGGPAADGLDGKEGQVAAIEGRDGQEIHHRQVDGEQGRKNE
jgi:hypothetical protein